MAEEVAGKKSRISNNMLLAILGMLVILIIVLTIALIVRNTVNNVSQLSDRDESSSVENVESSEEETENEGDETNENATEVDVAGVLKEEGGVDALLAVEEAITNYYAETEDVDATIAKYEEAMAAAQENGQEGIEYELYIDTASFMAKNFRCEDALKRLDQKDLSEASLDFLERYYAAAVSISTDCNNETERAEWQAKLDGVIPQDEEAMGW